jgi:hypothetical protein
MKIGKNMSSTKVMNPIQGLCLAMLAWCTLSPFAAEPDQSLLAVAQEHGNRDNASASISIGSRADSELTERGSLGETEELL